MSYITVIDYMKAVTNDIWNIEDWEIKHTRYVIKSMFEETGVEVNMMRMLGNEYYTKCRDLILDNILINDLLELLSLNDLNFILLYIFDRSSFKKVIKDEDIISNRLLRIKYKMNYLFLKLFGEFTIDDAIRKTLVYDGCKVKSEKMARILLANKVLKVSKIVEASNLYSEEFINYLIYIISYRANRIDNMYNAKKYLSNIYTIFEVRSKYNMNDYSEFFIETNRELIHQVTNLSMTTLCNIEKAILHKPIEIEVYDENEYFYNKKNNIKNQKQSIEEFGDYV